MHGYFAIDEHTLLILGAGIIALLAAVVPVLLRKKYISAPIVYVAIGIAGYLLLEGKYAFSPLENLSLVEHITEFVVLVALANAGLRIKEPFRWHTWRYSFRLLAIAMPLTIIAGAFLGSEIMGLAPATAILFGAIISPTDPVLASSLQTSEPGREDTSKSRLGLTSEAGINDGLAFPFTYLAIHVATEGSNAKEWLWSWLLHDFFIKMAIGIVMGLLIGWLLYKLVFSITSDNTAGKISRGILSLSLILLPYAITEFIGGYGFIAVFFAACMFSNYEEHLHHMTSLHNFNEELESFIVALIFITTGVFIALHYRIFYSWEITVIALLMVLVVRPLAGYISLIGTGLNPFQKFVLSFYGIRGIGSLYYLAFALAAANFTEPKKLFALTTATIFFSVMIHGISAHAVQKRIKKYDFDEHGTK